MDMQNAHVADIGDMVDAFYVPEDMAALWHAEMEIARVTAPECEEIIGRVTDHFEQLR